MKKWAFLLTFLGLFSANMNAQKNDRVLYRQNWDQKTMFLGYYLGLNKKSYKINYSTFGKSAIEVKSNMGFDVGIIGDLRLHKNINLRLEPGISSNTKELYFTHIPGGGNDSIRSVNSTYLRLPLLVKLSTDRYHNVRPYILGGISYDYNFSSNENSSSDNQTGEFRSRSHNASYEIGFGIDLYLPYFILSPSIRGGFSINDELVPDADPNSPWTRDINFLGTEGVFIKFAFH